jgi:hypothetical protein
MPFLAECKESKNKSMMSSVIYVLQYYGWDVKNLGIYIIWNNKIWHAGGAIDTWNRSISFEPIKFIKGVVRKGCSRAYLDMFF